MNTNSKLEFCTLCRKERPYVFRKRNITKTIRDQEYQFEITSAYCTECGGELNIPGLIDYNMQEIDQQYRAQECLVTPKDIQDLMFIYDIGKAPLSLALGFGEITITRYLAGQMPSKEYSAIMKEALSSPDYMQKLLQENKSKITESAYNKAIAAAADIQSSLFCVSDKLLTVISYVFHTMQEVTPLALQKLLYYIQGVSYALCGHEMFSEDCEAWVHGPVYHKVYDMFRDFRYNPIDDARFSILREKEAALSDQDKQVIDLVLSTFGMYGGKVLEKITHNEDPWRDTRNGYGDMEHGNDIISKASIKSYFDKINSEYDITTENGAKNYIRNMLKQSGM